MVDSPMSSWEDDPWVPLVNPGSRTLGVRKAGDKSLISSTSSKAPATISVSLMTGTWLYPYVTALTTEVRPSKRPVEAVVLILTFDPFCRSFRVTLVMTRQKREDKIWTLQSRSFISYILPCANCGRRNPLDWSSVSGICNKSYQTLLVSFRIPSSLDFPAVFLLLPSLNAQLREAMFGRILAQIEGAVAVRAGQYSKTPKRVWRRISRKLGACCFGWIYEKKWLIIDKLTLPSLSLSNGVLWR